jgi:hypothetical protein
MIFQHTAQWVLDRSPNTGEPKTQTRRRKYDNDICVRNKGALIAVYRNHRLLYRVGKVYSVQTGRGVMGIGHFRLTYIVDWACSGDISQSDANAEGFISPEAFREIWVRLYGLVALDKPCYALTLEKIQE